MRTDSHASKSRAQRRAEWDELISRLRSLSPDELQQTIDEGNENEQAAAVSVLAESAESAVALYSLIRVLESTDSALVRNAAAVVLHDIGDPAALEPLLRVVRRSHGSKEPVGTLVWALEAFDAAPALPLLVELLCGSEDFDAEVGWSAAAAIEGIRSLTDPSQGEQAKGRLERCRKRDNLPDWKDALISRALQHLVSLPPRANDGD